MSVLAPSSKSVTSVILVASKAGVRFVVVKEFLMPITAKSARKWRRIEMDVPKL